jgi:hypothetical protein
MDFLEKLEKIKYRKVRRKHLRKFIDEYRTKDKEYLYKTIIKLLEEWNGIYYDRQIYIDCNFNNELTHDFIATGVVKSEIDFVDTDDPIEHPGIVFRYTDKIKNDCYN